jgi:mannose-6-phosphate isomerase-like protein (cupin superfamily)
LPRPSRHSDPLVTFGNTLPMMKTNLTQAFATFSEHWSPRVAADLNGQQLKLVKFQGAFDWHFHEHEDELFLVHRGSFVMEFRDKRVELQAGEFLVVPRGVEHRPVAEHEVEVLLFEPASTLNTGNITSERTVAAPKRIAQ